MDRTASHMGTMTPRLHPRPLAAQGRWVRRGRVIVIDLSDMTEPWPVRTGESEQFLGDVWKRLRTRGRTSGGSPSGGGPSSPAQIPGPRTPYRGHPYREPPLDVAPPVTLPPLTSPAQIAELRQQVAQLEQQEAEARARWNLMRSVGGLSEQTAKEEYFAVVNQLYALRRRLQSALAR
jgi:hypothetical protein